MCVLLCVFRFWIRVVLAIISPAGIASLGLSSPAAGNVFLQLFIEWPDYVGQSVGHSLVRTFGLQKSTNKPLFVVITNCFDDDFVVPKKTQLEVIRPAVFISGRSQMADKCARRTHWQSSFVVVVVMGLGARGMLA